MISKKKNIFSSLEKFKKNFAIYYDGNLKSYNDLLKESNSFSILFKSKKVIFVLAENCYEFIVCYVAAIRSDLAIMIVNPNINKKSFLELKKKYLPEYIFCRSIFLVSTNYKAIKVFNNFSLFNNIHKHNYDINKEISCLLNTSGTMGHIRFVKLSSKNLLTNSIAISKALKIKANDTAITTMPPYYSYALSIINTHLMRGAKIIINNYSLVDKRFWDIFNNIKPTNLNGVPYFYEVLNKIKFEKIKLMNLKFITQAGGQLECNLKKKLLDFCKINKIKLYIMYGQTEASPRISVLPSNLSAANLTSVGFPLQGVKVWIEDEHNKKINKSNIEGNIICKGENIFMGYSESFKDLKHKNKINKILKTGDVGYIDKNGLLYITGRKKRISKIFGIRLSLDHLEKSLKKYNYNCVCIENNHQIKIYIKRNDRKKFNISNFNKIFMNITNLAPKFFKVKLVNDFPRNKIGKIIYN